MPRPVTTPLEALSFTTIWKGTVPSKVVRGGRDVTAGCNAVIWNTGDVTAGCNAVIWNTGWQREKYENEKRCCRDYPKTVMAMVYKQYRERTVLT
ncbi:hypothetical protein A2U01_0032350, partial [Trifolium medium]|nr:hypothetical protein [Trifolium medium]